MPPSCRAARPGPAWVWWEAGGGESDDVGPAARAARPGTRQDGAFGIRHAAGLAVQRLPLGDQGGDARRRSHEDAADAVLLLEGADDLAQCERLARAWSGLGLG
eukprot:scaffold73845_cov54-Phaeocystis_antarctica.AAC.1